MLYNYGAKAAGKKMEPGPVRQRYVSAEALKNMSGVSIEKCTYAGYGMIYLSDELLVGILTKEHAAITIRNIDILIRDLQQLSIVLRELELV